jgi:hypothetical protein
MMYRLYTKLEYFYKKIKMTDKYKDTSLLHNFTIL